MHHLLCAVERSLRGERRFVGKSEDLKDVPIKRNEVLVGSVANFAQMVLEGKLPPVGG